MLMRNPLKTKTGLAVEALLNTSSVKVKTLFALLSTHELAILCHYLLPYSTNPASCLCMCMCQFAMLLTAHCALDPF